MRWSFGIYNIPHVSIGSSKFEIRKEENTASDLGGTPSIS